MEAQEFGELIENEDEVNFALDGLKKGHKVRIRRAALSSLLSICESQYQRRSLRALGYVYLLKIFSIFLSRLSRVCLKSSSFKSF